MRAFCLPSDLVLLFITVRCLQDKLQNKRAIIGRQGKNWYAQIDGCIIMVNASSYTIITAHKEK
ncbi:DUF3781 domain-containing protein [Butyrivibrio fibrisolvens]|uniref:DUF3781 domain-containing protein n=1 Tax=Butyrivibrio fibrisolvens TaxID=831 RepID=UPI0009455EA3|nr:DUF3781 domain-containing protein [Butyrivibrio fibrisolvens]